MEQCALKCVDLLGYLNQQLFKERLKPITINPQDYAQIMNGLLLELQDGLLKSETAFRVKAGVDGGDEDGDDGDGDEDEVDGGNDNVVDGLVELPERISKDGNSRKEQDSQEKESDESDNDDDGKDDEKTPPVKQSKRTRKPRMEKKKMAKHYTPKTCPVCLVKVVNLRRHILEVHVKRNERLPLFG